MSELVLQESSDLNDSSSDDELNLIKKVASNYNLKKMIKSSDKVDKRLLDQYLIQQAHRMGVPLDLKGESFEEGVVDNKKGDKNLEEKKEED